LELVDVNTAEVLVATQINGNAEPVAAAGDVAILNIDSDVWNAELGAWVTDPESHRVVAVDPTGEITSLGLGRAAAGWSGLVALVDSAGQLVVHDLQTNDRSTVETDQAGNWTTLGGPLIPSASMPLPQVSVQGDLLMQRGTGSLDDGSRTTTSFVVSMPSATARVVTDLPSLATWSADGNWIAGIQQSTIVLVPLDNESPAIAWNDVIREGVFVLGAG
jgi:hypothetical protein